MNKVVKALMNVKLPITLIAICGTNRLLYQRLIRMKEILPPHIDLRPYEFAEKVYELNRAADLFLTKGGPNAMLDSVLMEVPVGVFYCASKIEYLSAFLFTSVLNCGRFLPHAKQIVKWVNKCVANPAILEPYVEATRVVRHGGNGAVQIANYIKTVVDGSDE